MGYNATDMFRGLLCIWFAIVSIVGPAFCCCLASSLFESTTCTGVEKKKPVQDGSVASCPHCKTKQRTKDPERPKPVPKQCPYCAERVSVDLMTPPVDELTGLTLDLDFPFVNFLSWVPRQDILTFASQQGLPPPDKPFNRDLLSLLQILRC
jgi:hypothetical protein